MSAIKNFFYLDEYKMYSISSQIFEGITEHLTDFRVNAKEESEEQRGPIGSGRLMADIMRSESASQERKYLHDYSYTLFERHLRESGMILSISENNIESIDDAIAKSSFVEIRAKAAFNDLKAIQSTIASYNEIGEAITYLSNSEEIGQQRDEIRSSVTSNRDRNRQARVRQQERKLEETLKQTAKAAGLQIDPTIIKHLQFLLDYGFQGVWLKVVGKGSLQSRPGWAVWR